MEAHGMRSLVVVGLTLIVAGVVSAQPAGQWLFGSTGRGTARWTEEAAGVTYRGGAEFGWAVLAASSLRDGFVEARFKLIAGREDQAGGVVWRWRDTGNYYVARANALEGNVVAYKVVGGRRSPIAPVGTPRSTYGKQVEVASGEWHTLRVEFRGTEAAVIYDGRPLYSVSDETFREPGRIGVWSKADSITEFLHPRYGELP